MGHPVNGELVPWDDVAEEHRWRNLLVGNGLSSHVWSPFRYSSLYEQACDGGFLTDEDQALFAAYETENFERVLSALSTSILTLVALGQPTDQLFDRYNSVKDALGEAVRGVHLSLSDFADEPRAAIRETLQSYRIVFTTSYDLILYWAAGYGETFSGFKDYFWSRGLEFDPKNVEVIGTPTRLLYLHGALHVVVDALGVTRKQKSTMWTLLEQFGMPDPDDPQSRPLLITEGSTEDKLRAIQNNDYLTFALTRLRRQKPPLVIFGHSLSEQDQHLLDALNYQPNRPIAVGMRPLSRLTNQRRQAEIRRALSSEDLFFYDATTHPLGDAALSISA